MGLWNQSPGVLIIFGPLYLARYPVAAMTLNLEVSLISGKTVHLEVDLETPISDVQLPAQVALGVGKGPLFDSAGNVLDGRSTVKDVGLQSGSSLMLQVGKTRICGGSLHAFAGILGDGSVMTWGDADCGGDCSAVQDRLCGVQQIQSNNSAFAAILGDGSVIAWGRAGNGGDSSAVKDRLIGVQHVQSTKYAFAAILGNGSVVTWGDAGSGGDCSAVQHQLSGVQQIQSTDSAFAAVLGDGSVITWGGAFHGGDSSAVQDRLQNVQQVQSTHFAFAAILGDGSMG